MNGQNFKNHAQMVPLFHYVLFPITMLSLIGCIVNLYKSVEKGQGVYSASLLLVAFVCIFIAGLLGRVFALKAQDRAIRAEENLRHFVLTGKLLDSRLTVQQIIALRFAPDTEFVDLARKAAESGTEPKAIKESIKNWKGDYHRV